MLNTHRLLYILPDVAYVAELLPAKKPSTFAIQSFRQINGDFLDDNEFIAENVLKLFSKLENESYHLILPDFLFTNTIISTKETGDAKVKKYLKESLLPDLSLTEETHGIETFILSELKGESKVQLSAIEKSVLAPVRAGAHQAKVTIEDVSPLSWTLKSVISLEPSISIMQIGGYLYSALHYIGVDQTNHASLEDVEAIGETIKTLKGAEPSIQTIYLLGNSLIEQKLKDQLSNTLPIQQLNTFKEEDSQMPSYVKEIIESSMKTLAVEEYPVPRFNLGKPSSEELDHFVLPKDTEPQEAKEEAGSDLPIPTKTEEKTIKDEADKPKETTAVLPPPVPVPVLAVEEDTPSTELSEVTRATEVADSLETKTEESEELESEKSKPDVDLVRFSPRTSVPSTASETSTVSSTIGDTDSHSSTHSKTIIKNSSGVGPMLKMIFITLAVFAATVAIGVGVGLGLLQLTNKDQGEVDTTPVVVTTPSPVPSPSPTPSASPAAQLNKEELSILVVNATTKAGYAGTIKTKLVDDGFGTVDTGNAKGDYEAGNYVLLDEENAALLAVLGEVTNLDVEYDKELDKKTEDTQAKYDAVVVLAE